MKTTYLFLPFLLLAQWVGAVVPKAEEIWVDQSAAPGGTGSDSAPFLEGKVWSLAVVGRSESKKRETLFFFLCLIMGRSSSFRQSSVLLSYGRSYGIRCRRRFEQHSHPQRPWLRRQQEQLDQFGTGEIGSQRSRRRLF